MNKYASTFFLLCVILFIGLLGCGEDSKISGHPLPIIGQSILIVTSEGADQVPDIYTNPDSIFVDIGETIKFTSNYTLNGQPISGETANQFYASHLWNIEGDLFNVSSFRYSFDSPGEKKAILKTADYFGDTLSDTVFIFVNTPAEINLISPFDRYNQVDPLLKNALEMEWETKGIDPWENSNCYLYIDTDKAKVWDNLQGVVNCSKKVYLHGPLTLEDTSSTLYWAMQMTTFTADSYEEVRSPIYSFTTLLPQGDSSVVKIPYSFKHYHLEDSLSTDIILINAAGDTLKKFQTRTPYGSITTNVKEQNNLQIVVKENRHSEYRHDVVKVDIPAHSTVFVDSIFMVDSIPPMLEFTKSLYSTEAFVNIAVLDNGSGVNWGSLQTFVNGIDVDAIYMPPFIMIPKEVFMGKAKISFFVEDNARNASSPLFWKAENINNSVAISGPFIDTGNSYGQAE
ncbi:MAG: hypothetical protein HUK21_03360 [Fibrobacteraceae bacterium]|nr:hypothetical protein [Fibrobacteraceae bacterium]